MDGNGAESAVFESTKYGICTERNCDNCGKHVDVNEGAKLIGGKAVNNRMGVQ